MKFIKWRKNVTSPGEPERLREDGRNGLTWKKSGVRGTIIRKRGEGNGEGKD
jgi:hypothetical protein